MDINMHKHIAHKLGKERDQYKAENEKLEERSYQLVKINDGLHLDNYKLEQENKALRLQANTYFDEWQEAKKNYITLTYHIRLKASVNPGEHRYIALVNLIDRLECE